MDRDYRLLSIKEVRDKTIKENSKEELVDIIKKQADKIVEYRFKSVGRRNLYSYKAKLIRIIASNEIIVDLDLGFSIYKRMRLVLGDISVPKKQSKNHKERRAAKLLEEYVRHMTRQVDLVVSVEKLDDYSAYIYIPELGIRNTSLNEILVDRELAKNSSDDWKEEELDNIISKLSFLEGMIR